MNKVIYNIGYSATGSGILTWYPESLDMTFPEFAKELRKDETILDLFQYAKDVHVPPSSIILMIRIENETEYWEYTIKMINVREYRKHWETKYGKKWKEN
jgi:hypothetical protein